MFTKLTFPGFRKSHTLTSCDVSDLQRWAKLEVAMKTRLILVDDHHMMRDGLRRMLTDHQDFDVIGEAANGRQAVQLVRELAPDVVLMDAHMPDLNGVDATRQIVAANPAVRVICLSGQEDQKTASEMLYAGAAGYVGKASAFEELADAIRTVVQGRLFLSPSITGMVLSGYADAGSRREIVWPTSVPSGREREVLQLIAEGKSTKQVARCMSVSTKTVETHRRNLMNKLKLDNVADLTKYAIREGIISLDASSN